MAQMQNSQYERAIKLWATSDTNGLMHYCYAILHDTLKEAQTQREIEEARDRMEKIKQSGNAEYERALKAWVSSDVKSLVHFVFSSWHDASKEAVREREIEEAQERMAQM